MTLYHVTLAFLWGWETWMVRRIRLQPSIQATSSLRSMYSGTVLERSNWICVHAVLTFFCRRIRIFPHGNLLLSRNSSGLSTVKGSFSSFTVITTIARPWSGRRCGLDLNWNVLRLEYRDWIIQELPCPCHPAWSHGGQMKTCSNMQEQAWNHISFYQSHSSL